MENIVLKVAGMSCQGCVRSVTSALQAVPGVTDVDVSLANGEATIKFQPGRVEIGALKQAIEDAGFEAP